MSCWTNLLTAVKNSFYIWTINFYCWRALSNQTVPCQALTKIKKRTTTKIKKWKLFRWSPNPKVCLPVNQVHLSSFPFTQLSWYYDYWEEQERESVEVCRQFIIILSFLCLFYIIYHYWEGSRSEKVWKCAAKAVAASD